MKNSHLAKAFLAARDKLIAHAPEVATSWDYPRGGYRLGWVTDEHRRFAVRWLPKYGVVADGCTTNGYIDILAWQCYPGSTWEEAIDYPATAPGLHHMESSASPQLAELRVAERPA